MIYHNILMFCLVMGSSAHDIRICFYDLDQHYSLAGNIPTNLCNHIAYSERQASEITYIRELRESNPVLKILYHYQHGVGTFDVILSKLESLFETHNLDGIIFDSQVNTVDTLLYIPAVCNITKTLGKPCYITSTSIHNLSATTVREEIETLTDGVIINNGKGRTSKILVPPTTRQNKYQRFLSLDENIRFLSESGYPKTKMIGSINLELGTLCKYNETLKKMFGLAPTFGDKCHILPGATYAMYCTDKLMKWFEDNKEGFTYGYDEVSCAEGGYFAAFETPKSAEIKTKYMAEQGLGGFLFHSLILDKHNAEACDVEGFPILEAAAKGFEKRKNKSVLPQ